MTASEPTIEDIGEFGLIRRIAEIVGEPPTGIGIGDDAAVIPLGDSRVLLATTDKLVEGVHFRFETQSPYVVGRRAVAINVSDIAAMGGVPAHCLVSLALSAGTTVQAVEELYRGIRVEADRWGLIIIGGNIARTAGPISIDVMMLGLAPSHDIVLRSGAVVNDLLAVTGTLGGAAALRLAREAGLDAAMIDPLLDLDIPTPRVAEGLALASSGLTRAMLDLSDGLAGDLAHMCTASDVGACIVASSLPIRKSTAAVAQKLGLEPLRLALTGGEDYELLLALSPGSVSVARALIHPTALTIIGRCETTDSGITLEQNGSMNPLDDTGWEHF